jgi:hypothetical protein
MNKFLMWLLIALGVIILIVIFPKQYSYNFGSDCSLWDVRAESGWCLGTIYSVNETWPGTPAEGSGKDSCTEYKRGSLCNGFSFAKAMVAIA